MISFLEPDLLFFIDFMEAFFPYYLYYYSVMDLKQVEFVDHGIVDFPGKRHKRLDKLIKTRLYGESDYSLILVEHQSQKRKYFGERLFIYYTSLYKNHRCRIIPIAVFAYKYSGQEEGVFILKEKEDVTTINFKYNTLVLRRLWWKDYIDYNNPTVAAFLSSMDYRKEEKVPLKLAFYKMLLRIHLDPAKQRLVILYFESYLNLSQEENKELEGLMNKEFSVEEVKQMEDVMIEWEEKGYKKALDELEQLKNELAKTRNEVNKAYDEVNKAYDEANRAHEEVEQYKNEIDQIRDEHIEMILKIAQRYHKRIPSDWSSALKDLSLKQITKLSTFMIEDDSIIKIQEYKKN